MSRYSRKDYEMVAATIRAEVEDLMTRGEITPILFEHQLDALNSLASRFVTVFEADNESFDRERFLVAAGLTF